MNSNPLHPIIPSGTRVRLRTENGGDTIVTVSKHGDYRPTFSCWFTTDGGHTFNVDMLRISSVVPV